MLIGGKVTQAPEAMKERVKFVMCALDPYQNDDHLVDMSQGVSSDRPRPFRPELVLGGLTCASAMTIGRH
jgi:hypothetical protein